MTIRTKRFERPTLLVVAVVLGAHSIGSTHASAQSAEETVAIMLWGLEERPKIRRVAENLWEAEAHNGDRSSFSVLRSTDCRFHVSSQVQRGAALEVLEFDYVLDFAAARDYSAWFANGSDQRIIVKIEGLGWYTKTARSKATGRVVQNINAGSVDVYVAEGGSVERLRRAYADFRTNHCRRRAVIGEVVEVDAPKGIIAVKHTRIEQPGLSLPEGTHQFRAQSDLLGGMIFNALRPGDEIKFSAARVNGEFVLTEVDRAK